MPSFLTAETEAEVGADSDDDVAIGLYSDVAQPVKKPKNDTKSKFLILIHFGTNNLLLNRPNSNYMERGTGIEPA